MRQPFICLALLVMICAPSLAHADQMGIAPSDPSLVIDPRLLKAKALLEPLPFSARSALGSRLVFDYSWRASVVPKMTQLMNGEDLPAPAVDSDFCRLYRSPLPQTKAIRESSRESTSRLMETEVVTREISFWEELRTETYEALRLPVLDTGPVVSSEDLCDLKMQMEIQEGSLSSEMDQMTDILVGILKDPDVASIQTYRRAAETYLTALTTLYLNGRLVAEEGMAPGCVNLNLLDFNVLMPKKYLEFWEYGIDPKLNQYAWGYGLKPLISQLACLPDAEALRFANAFGNAMRITDGVVQSTQPKLTSEIRKMIHSDYLPFMVALFDRTKSVGPGNPLYKLLLDYRKSQGFSEKTGIHSLFFFNPSTQTYVETPVCNESVIQQASDYIAEKWGSGPGPKPILQQHMQLWLDNYNNDYKKGLGPKTLYGAAITMVSMQSTTLAAPVWITDAWTPNLSGPACVYLPNFMHVFLHPMPLAEATCPAWDTARLGKVCPFKFKAPPSVSQMETLKGDGLAMIANAISEWIMPTAHAGEPPKPKCLFDTELIENPNCPIGPDGCCIKQGCPCGYEKDNFGKPTPVCAVCPLGGGVPASKTLLCKDSCKYRYGMDYAGGSESAFYGSCYLTTPLVESENVGTIVVPKDDHCNIAKVIKLSTSNTTAYDACLEKGSCCGNGVVEEGETCDDGNGITTDMCNNSCVKGTDCKAACNFGYKGPATQMLKKIVDARTNFHPVYRWLGTSLFFESIMCTLPESITDGKTILDKGKPCHEIMAPLLKMVNAEQKTCVKQCQAANPNLPPPVSAKSAECYEYCKPEKLSECQAAKQYYAKMMAPGCKLANGVIQGEKVYCNPGAPCTCGWDFVLEPCKQIVAACKADCASKYKEGFSNDEIGGICQDWSQQNVNGEAEKSAMNFFMDTVEAAKDALKYASQQPTLDAAMQTLKEAGAKKFDNLFATMMDWIDYDHFSSMPADQRELVQKAAQYALDRISTCDGARAKFSEAKVKGNFTGIEPLVAIGPIAGLVTAEAKALQPYTMETTYYKDVKTDFVQFDYWKKAKKGGIEQTVKTYVLNSPGMDNVPLPDTVLKEALNLEDVQMKSWSKVENRAITVVEKVVPKLRAFALLGRANVLMNVYDMAGDTPIKPEFELSTKLQLCVNPEGLSDMSPDDLAKLGAQQAMVAAMQFQDWVRRDAVDAIRPFDDIVDANMTNSIEFKLEKLGVTIPKPTDNTLQMTTLCESYFSGEG